MCLSGISVRPTAELEKLLTPIPFLKSVFADEDFVPIVCNLKSIRN
jgi:hypothetical protein